MFLHAVGGFGIEVERALLERVFVDPAAGVVTLVLEQLLEEETTASVMITGLQGTSAEVAMTPDGWRHLGDGGSVVVEARVSAPTELRIWIRG